MLLTTRFTSVGAATTVDVADTADVVDTADATLTGFADRKPLLEAHL